MKEAIQSYRIFLRVLLSLVIVLIFNPSFGQTDLSFPDNSLDSSEIKDLVELSKYNKTEQKLKLKNGNIDVEEAPKTNLPSGLGPILQGLLYLFIAGLVIFILYLIFSSIKVDKKVKPVTLPKTDKIEDIEIIDAESGLEMALKSENYREALRMLFIKLLQILVEEKSIEWRPEKTNRNYLKEMATHEKFIHFNNLVIAYERIWYGTEPIDRLFFNYLKADFEKFYSTKNVNIDVEE